MECFTCGRIVEDADPSNPWIVVSWYPEAPPEAMIGELYFCSFQHFTIFGQRNALELLEEALIDYKKELMAEPVEDEDEHGPTPS